MLTELRIQNLAVIEDLVMEFSPGFNVLTGETGAGKSLILNALGLILGEKASLDLIRTGEEFARVEAAFDDALPEMAKSRLGEAGILPQADEPLIISRQIHANGRGRAYVNGQLVTNSLLKSLGEAMVDIHGQHEHQSLFRVEQHLELLDAFAQVGELRNSVAESHRRIESLRQRLRSLQQDLKTAQHERELLEHQVEELTRAALKPGEDETLDAERKRLQNAERLFATAHSLFNRLLGERKIGLVESFRGMFVEAQTLARLDETQKEVETRLESVYYELEDLARHLRDYRDSVEFNPQRLADVEERLHWILQLKRKVAPTIEEILVFEESAKQRLNALATGAEEVERTKELLRTELREGGRLAFSLSEQRQEAAESLARKIEAELAELSMKNTRFRVAVSQMEAEAGLIRRHEKGYKLGQTGLDTVEFLMAPNVGEELRPLNKIASGGEISRIMLAIKTVLSRMDTIPTLVFDEVDSGIGGRTATTVGGKLRDLSRTRQTLCVTHLPQIAAFADAHFRIEKRTEGNGVDARTRTIASRLAPEERVTEVARMLGDEGEKSRALAEQMLDERGLGDGR